MKKQLYPLLFLLLSLCFSACSDEGKRFHALDENVTLIMNNPSTTSAEQIRSSILELDKFLSDYPDSKHKGYLMLQRRALSMQLEQATFNALKEKYEAALAYQYSDAADEYQRAIDLFTTSEAIQLQDVHPEIKDWLQKLKDDKALIDQMKEILEREYNSVENFNGEVRDNDYRFRNQGANIAKVWEAMIDVYQSKVAKQVLLEKVKDFERELAEDAQNICLNDFQGFDVQRVETVSMGTPKEHDKYMRYECEGVFRVYLVGAIIGWDKGSVKLSIKGRISARVDDNNRLAGVAYSRTDYSILEKSGF